MPVKKGMPCFCFYLLWEAVPGCCCSPIRCFTCWSVILSCSAGFSSARWREAADASGAENPGALFLICAGLVAAVALVLPGISVSYLLLMMDMYNTVIQSISRLYLPYLLPLGAGVLLGIILTTKLLERAMEKHPQQTYLLILGFVLGSLPELFPGFPVSVPQWLMCLFSLALGGGAIWLLSSREA